MAQSSASSTRRRAAPRVAQKPKQKGPVRMLARPQVAGAVRTLGEPRGTARFRAGKALLVTAEKDPARLYPHFDAIAALLASDCKIVCWDAILLIGRLAAVDAAHKVDGVLDTCLAFVRGPSPASAGNALRCAGQILTARPDLLERILPRLLSVETTTYATPECRNVALQQLLTVLEDVWPLVGDRPEIAALVRRQQANPRAGAARRAQRLVTRLD